MDIIKMFLNIPFLKILLLIISSNKFLMINLSGYERMLWNLLKKMLNPAGKAKLITSFFQIGLAMVKKILGDSSAYPFILN